MSKYERLAGKQEMESDGKVWNRYGFSELEWAAMTTQEREIHYNRQKKCEHPYEYDGPSWSNETIPESLRTAYSHNPYFHTAHMDPCKRWAIKPPARWAIECNCQMCLGNFGLTDEDKPRKVNEEAVRLKWQQKFSLVSPSEPR